MLEKLQALLTGLLITLGISLSVVLVSRLWSPRIEAEPSTPSSAEAGLPKEVFRGADQIEPGDIFRYTATGIFEKVSLNQICPTVPMQRWWEQRTQEPEPEKTMTPPQPPIHHHGHRYRDDNEDPPPPRRTQNCPPSVCLPGAGASR